MIYFFPLVVTLLIVAIIIIICLGAYVSEVLKEKEYWKQLYENRSILEITREYLC